MVIVGNVRHSKLKNSEECLYFDVTLRFERGRDLTVKGFQLFRGLVSAPKSRDKQGTYWPVFQMPGWLEADICANLRSMGLADKHPGVQFPPTAEEF